MPQLDKPGCVSCNKNLSSTSQILLCQHESAPIRATGKSRPLRIQKRRRTRRIGLLPPVGRAAQIPYQISALDPRALQRSRRIVAVVAIGVGVDPVVLWDRSDVEG